LKKYKTLLCGFALFLFLSTGAAFAQYGAVKPYLVAAGIEVAADAEADIWLNDIYVGHCPYTTMETGCQSISAKGDSLCYFKKNNLLAILLRGAKGHSGDGFIGVAYAFWFKLSDGTFRVIHSSSTDEHRCFYLTNSDADEPIGWRKPGFDDSQWATAQSSGDMIPNTATLAINRQGVMAGFLTATQGYLVQFSGEKQLFRRSFTLDISTNPRCLPQSSPAPANPYLSAYSQPARPPDQGPFQSITPQVLPAHRQPLQALPQLQRPTLQPTFQWVDLSGENPPTATPTAAVYAPSVSAPVPTAAMSPSDTPTPIVQNDGAIVFGSFNANILVSFGDGPGIYSVEAVDANFGHLKTLLNQRIVSASDMWLSWDGKDDAGNDVPPGRYYVLCSKEGVVLQKIILRRVSP
jgi:hypothetical protein